MEEEVKQHYIRAGEVIQGARQEAREVAEPGASFRDVAEAVEDFIREQGLEPAFPVNVSVDEEAAHYTPGVDEDASLGEDDVVKIDIGAHSEGYIADTALTVNPSGSQRDMVDAVEEVLEKALEFIEPGVKIGEFGSYVEQQVPEEYRVIQNLTGHYLGRYEQHAGVSIPNTANTSGREFSEGDAVAIEPFLTDGAGTVKNGRDGNIYKMEKDVNVRGRTERQLMKQIKGFNGLPFTTRWLSDFGGRQKMALKRLVDQGVVHSYPVLKDVNDGTVVQAEHTVLIGADDGENIVTTRR